MVSSQEIVSQFTEKIKLQNGVSLSDDEAKQILRSLGMKIIRVPGCNLPDDVKPLNVKFIAEAVSPLFKLVQHSKSSEVTLKENKMDVILSEVKDGMIGVSTSQKLSQLKKDPEFESKKENYIVQLNRVARSLCSDFPSKSNIIFFPFRYLENKISDTVVIESQEDYKRHKFNEQVIKTQEAGSFFINPDESSNVTVDIPNGMDESSNVTVEPISTMPKVGGRKVPKKVYRSKSRKRRIKHKGGQRKSKLRRFKRIN